VRSFQSGRISGPKPGGSHEDSKTCRAHYLAPALRRLLGVPWPARAIPGEVRVRSSLPLTRPPLLIPLLALKGCVDGESQTQLLVLSVRGH